MKNIITLSTIEKKMKEEEFDSEFINVLIDVFQKHNPKINEEDFHTRMYKLHYSLPSEFHDEETCIMVYQQSQAWIENEVIKLENETRLSWDAQTEDLQGLDERVRKTQLVIRHRLSEIVYDLVD
ncbi:hypothetical protein [Mesobacillus selenatarsenatis]|uniref:Uncharacterized protein n=1 Tax=Mesobacillus selenatarsenatis (strain DSM 18680 / JCM 14380 / FERM P-15431 / SF-1) TaxID=1321606 RepID=A0A0A8X9M8_MESS1|nr:hypothetical protein [Mesobacillus selenatarsenatis]GAM16675.1 BH3280 unknown [Mesobacillus selenatarsenatis SF-1]